MKLGIIKAESTISRIIAHIIFWASYLLFLVIKYTYLLSDPDYTKIILNYACYLSVQMLATYFTAYVLFPKFLFKRKYVLAFLVFIVSSIIFIYLYRVVVYFVIFPVFYPEIQVGPFSCFNHFLLLAYVYQAVVLFMIIKLLKFWYINQNIRLKLENQNKNSELALLRSQINPHFLFNTLNNIDVLIAKDRKKASDSIMELSSIMRYMLYDSNTEYVPLSKEISYLQSYISLQKIRLKNPDLVKFEVKGSDSNKLIAPMLLIPFVENAFKHGAMTAQVHGVYIDLAIENEYLEFVVINDVSEISNLSKDSTQGIGLNNVKRRLELIYKDQYSLEIKSTNNKFKVEFKLYFHAD